MKIIIEHKIAKIAKIFIYIIFVQAPIKKKKKYKNIKHNIESTNKIINNFKIVKIYLHHPFAKKY